MNDNILYFPERSNKAMQAFQEFVSVLTEDEDVTDFDVVEVLLDMDDLRLGMFKSDMNLLKLYKSMKKH